MEDESDPERSRGRLLVSTYVASLGVGLLLFQVHIYQAGLKELDYEAIEKFKYENYSLHDEETDVMPLKWYEAQPVVSKKIVVMHLQ